MGHARRVAAPDCHGQVPAAAGFVQQKRRGDDNTNGLLIKFSMVYVVAKEDLAYTHIC